MLTTTMEQDKTRVDAQEGCIALTRPAALQLLLLGLDERVREAAADALEHLIAADPTRLRCIDADLRSVPRWERTAALLVATMAERDPASVGAWGVQQDHEAASPPDDFVPHRFQYTTAPISRSTARVDGVEEVTFHRITFEAALSREADLTRYARRSWRILKSGDGDSRGQWQIDRRGASLSVGIPYKAFRGTSGWKDLRLLSPEGRLIAEYKPIESQVGRTHGFTLDLGFLFRSESGALKGCVLERRYEAVQSRPGRSRRAVLTVELGESLDTSTTVALAYGDVCPDISINRLGGEAQIFVPLLGGATLASLDAIARNMGVWHGDSLRGSFAHHPLRARSLAGAA